MGETAFNGGAGAFWGNGFDCGSRRTAGALPAGGPKTKPE